MQARRDALKHVRPNEGTHVGLWLDRYLDDQNDQRSNDSEDRGQKEDKGQKAKHVLSAQNRPVPKGYPEAFDRWRQSFNAHDGTTLATPIEAKGRIALGLGNKGVLENGLQLDHTWGVPIIPGSALKGVAAAAAHLLAEGLEWRKGKSAHDGRGAFHAALFGQGGTSRLEGGEDADTIGRVRFLDAWWIPRDDRERPLETLPIHLDIMTVHHADYYGEKKDKEGQLTLPLDTDRPNPVPFATLSGRYLLVVQLTDPEDDPRWLDLALDLLEEGLAELGVGAKTNAGYGRMTLEIPESSALERREAFKESALPGEERWLRDNAPLLQKSPTEQADWLLEHGRTLPDGYGFDDTAWRGLMTSAIPTAINLLKLTPEAAASAVDLDAEIDALKRRRHEVQQTPVNKRDDKAVRRRRNELDGIEVQIKLKESQKANQAAFAEREANERRKVEERRQAFLAWLRGEG